MMCQYINMKCPIFQDNNYAKPICDSNRRSCIRNLENLVEQLELLLKEHKEAIKKLKEVS